MKIINCIKYTENTLTNSERTNDNSLNIDLNLENNTLLKNRGTGSGGKNTNKTGKSFEDKTSIEQYLEKNGYVKNMFDKENKYGYFYEIINGDTKIIYLKQTGLKKYLTNNYNITCFYKQPDEAYIIEQKNNKILKILEKKNQNGKGSVEEKLKTAVYVRDVEYSKNINKVFNKTEYAYCVNQYLYNTINQNKKKYEDMRNYFKENNIQIFNGDDENYFQSLYNSFVIKN